MLTAFKWVNCKLMIGYARLISAGPVGNLAQRQVPPPDQEKRLSLLYYFVQFISFVPGLCYFWHPVVLMVGLVLYRLYTLYKGRDSFLLGTDLFLIPLGFIAFDN